VRYLNLVSTEDLMEPLSVEGVSEAKLEGMPAEFRVLPGDSLKDAFNKMVEHGKSVLPVASEDGQILGQVTVNSIVQGIIRDDHEAKAGSESN